MPRHDLIIVGAGPVGMTLALALKDSGLDILLVDARARGAARHDPRVLALSHGSRLTLERLGIWPQLQATPIETIHISQQGRLGRSQGWKAAGVSGMFSRSRGGPRPGADKALKS